MVGAGTEYVGGKITKPVRKALSGVHREAFEGPAGAVARTARETAEKYKVPITAQELAGKPTALSLEASRAGFTPFARLVSEKAQQDATTKSSRR